LKGIKMLKETDLKIILNYVDKIKPKSVKIGGRTAAKLSEDEFKQILISKTVADDFWEYDEDCDPYNLYCNLYYDLIVQKDLNKINFDFENHEIIEMKSKDGVPYLICWAGGDWEVPVTFFLYYDGKNVRGYVPENGNTFNQLTRTAFGSEDYEDNDKLIKFLSEYMDSNKICDFLVPLGVYKLGNNEFKKDFGELFSSEFNPYEIVSKFENLELMETEFLQRIGFDV